MTARLIMHLCVLFCAAVLPVAAQAQEPLARCYLIPWHVVFRAAPHPEQVRQWADMRCSVESAAQLARLRAILQLEKLRASPPETRDLRLVVDFLRADGGLETYCADRFYLMSADLRRSRRVGGGFRREVDSFFRSCSPKSSNQAMQLTASKPAVYAFSVYRRRRMLRTMRIGLAAADLVSR